MTVRETAAMIAGVKSELTDGDYVFCTTSDEQLAARCLVDSVAMFREEEGITLVLPLSKAVSLGFDCSMAMRRITLNVYSALDGVGLTATVATALAREGIPCNMVAAYHHDHAFVPAARAETAVAVLERLSDGTVSSAPGR